MQKHSIYILESMMDASDTPFPSEFRTWLRDNMTVWDAFVDQADAVIKMGYSHYSSRTIIEVLRHHTALRETGNTGWKLNDHNVPYLSRLFAVAYPHHRDLFAFRTTNLERAAEELV